MNQSLFFKLYHGSIVLFILLLSARHAIAQTDDTTMPHPKFHDTGSHKSLGAGTTVVLVLFISVFVLTGFLSIYLRHCSDSRFSLPHGANGTSNLSRSPSMPHGHGLDPAVVNTFPTFLYSQVKGHRIGERALECAVCLLEFEDDQILRLLPSCNHVFHPVCIDAWLARHVSCPVCRANLIPKPGEQVTHVTTTLCPPDSYSIITGSKLPPAGYGIDSGSVDLIIDINDTSPTPEHHTPNYQNLPPRSTPRKPKKAESKFRRSHSAGHTIVQPEDKCERFTLRLPEDVQNHLKLMKTSPSSNSAGVFLSVRSPRKGYRSSSVGSSRGKNYERFDSGGRSSGWNFRMTPPFVSQAGSVRSAGDDSTATPMNWKKSPLDYMFRGRDKDDDGGRRSTSRLIPDDDA